MQADRQHEAETDELAVARLEERAPARRVFRIVLAGHANCFEPVRGLGDEERQDHNAHTEHGSDAEACAPVPVPIFSKSVIEYKRRHKYKTRTSLYATAVQSELNYVAEKNSKRDSDLKHDAQSSAVPNLRHF